MTSTQRVGRRETARRGDLEPAARMSFPDRLCEHFLCSEHVFSQVLMLDMNWADRVSLPVYLPRISPEVVAGSSGEVKRRVCQLMVFVARIHQLTQVCSCMEYEIHPRVQKPRRRLRSDSRRDMRDTQWPRLPPLHHGLLQPAGFVGPESSEVDILAHLRSVWAPWGLAPTRGDWQTLDESLAEATPPIC